MKLIRNKILACGQSRYEISKATGIDKAVLCRIMQGGSCKAETIDKLFEYFNLVAVDADKLKKR